MRGQDGAIPQPRCVQRDILAPERGPDRRAVRSATTGPSLAARLLLVPIHLYRRFISPALPPACRFTPTCSQYAVEALTRHGAFKGSWLAIRRLGRCHPWHPGGEDPVP